jgi:prepilin-type N-terminal cleavage/methylation domain-containing protein/prepilin-type processing-associated H-X9-DG protein
MKMKKTRGFTLIELLVVVAIIAVLISILLPSLQQARDSARTLQCSSHLRNYGTAIKMYADEYNGKICIGGGKSGIYWMAFYNKYLNMSVNKMNWDPAYSENPPADTDPWKAIYGINYELWSYSTDSNVSWKDLSNQFYVMEKFHPWGLLMTDTFAYTHQTGDYGQYEDHTRHGGRSGKQGDMGKANYLFPDGHVETLYIPIWVPPWLGGPVKIRDIIDEMGSNY